MPSITLRHYLLTHNSFLSTTLDGEQAAESDDQTQQESGTYLLSQLLLLLSNPFDLLTMINFCKQEAKRTEIVKAACVLLSTIFKPRMRASSGSERAKH